MIEVENLSHVYRTSDLPFQALRGVSFMLDRGSFTALMGPSGSGKSTLLSLLGLILPAQEGRIVLSGTEVGHLPTNQSRLFRARNIGFVFQHFRLLPGLTAKENIMFTCFVNKWNRHAAGERADELLDQLGISALSGHFPNQMSGGQMQRVAFARAIAPRPSLLLADEPTGNLDTKSGELVLSLLRETSLAGTTVVMATHSTVAAAYCGRILTLRDGILI